MKPELCILAYCEEMLAILAEIALDCGYVSPFRIVENMDVEKGRWASNFPGVRFASVRKSDWSFSGKEKVVFSVVQPPSKQKVFREFQDCCHLRREHYANLIHSSCFVSKTVKLGGGLVMEPLSVISSHTTVGFGVNIRRGVNVGHHVHIGDFVSINPGVSISGKVRIGAGATIGVGAVILDDIEIGRNSFVGAGSVVTRSIPPDVVAYGSPCKVVRKIT